ncbi:MAG TPA: hypothetical protein VFF32_05640 [Dermatophilaceae bacterium]|nr:hypothetical protein [Dermatophilaceae bacterium]
MTDQPQPSIGTVAEEAARLISAVAAMAPSTGTTTHDPSQYSGCPAPDLASPPTEHSSPLEDTVRPDDAPPERASSEQAPNGDPGPGAPHVCTACGGVNDGTPVACKLCPLCQGIALLRSVRPETVDRLADLASVVATTLRDMATQSRASGPGSGSGSGPGRPSDGPVVQDIRVDDGDEG